MDSRDAKRSSKPVSQAGYDLTRLDYAKLIKERKLSRVQRYVTGGGTELPFTGRTSNGFSYKNKRRGVYRCAVCELPAYSSKHKFDSGTGWPSFFKGLSDGCIKCRVYLRPHCPPSSTGYRPRSRLGDDGCLSWDCPKGGLVRPVPCTPGACIQGWPSTNGTQVLHQYCLSDIQASEGG